MGGENPDIGKVEKTADLPVQKGAEVVKGTYGDRVDLVQKSMSDFTKTQFGNLGKFNPEAAKWGIRKLFLAISMMAAKLM